jgi:hypothetical protein
MFEFVITSLTTVDQSEEGNLAGFFVLFFGFFFETGSHYVAQVGFEMKCSCLSLLSAQITYRTASPCLVLSCFSWGLQSISCFSPIFSFMPQGLCGFHNVNLCLLTSCRQLGYNFFPFC